MRLTTLLDLHRAPSTKATERAGSFGYELRVAIHCRNISAETVTVCPTCDFRDIEACPYCNNEVARLAYTPVSGDPFTCPVCHRRVRLQFSDPIYDANGHYNQPLVHVVPAEAPVNHEV